MVNTEAMITKKPVSNTSAENRYPTMTMDFLMNGCTLHSFCFVGRDDDALAIDKVTLYHKRSGACMPLWFHWVSDKVDSFLISVSAEFESLCVVWLKRNGVDGMFVSLLSLAVDLVVSCNIVLYSFD